MYENKKKINFIYTTFIICSFFILFTGCQSLRGTENYVLQHQKRITELEGRVGELTKEIDRASKRIGDITESSSTRLDDIRRRADEISGTVDRVIFLFDSYEREVQLLLSEISGIRAEEQIVLQADNDRTGTNTIISDSKDNNIFTKE